MIKIRITGSKRASLLWLSLLLKTALVHECVSAFVHLQTGVLCVCVCVTCAGELVYALSYDKCSLSYNLCASKYDICEDEL